MKILLIDIDSKIPNLALMKLSAWYKGRGDKVEFNNYLSKPDKVFASCVFRENAWKVRQMPFDDSKIIAGGSGLENWKITLDHDIEHFCPDYSLYNCHYSLGFITRGCVKNCPYCIVFQKEGGLRLNSPLSEFVRHKEVVFLDNNILAYKDCKDIFREIIERDLTIDFNQGLDFDYLTEEKAMLLAKMKWLKRIRFVFDDIKREKNVKKGIKMLRKAGIKMSKVMIYVLCGFNTTFGEDMYRIGMLKGLGVDPFVMLYHKRNKLLNEMARWINLYYFRDVSFREFLGLRNYEHLIAGD